MKSLRVILLAGITIMGALNTPAQTWVTNKLLLYYPFNGKVQDASGHGNNPTISVATPAPDRFGNPTNAMAFNGVNSGLVIPNFFYNSVPSGTPLTESIWFCPSNNLTKTNLFTLVVNGHYSGAQYGLCLYSIGNGLQAYEYAYDDFGFNYTSFAATAAQTNFAANVWHHAVGVFTDSSIQIYLDGVLQGSASFSSLGQDVYSDLNIGAQEWNNGTGYRFGFQGRLDDVRIYNRALSGTEVAQLFTLESPQPVVGLISAVVPTFSNLQVGSLYQLQASGTVSGSYTNYGQPFTATNSAMNYANYVPVNNATALFFRLQLQ